MESKSLKTIQTLSKIGKVLSKIVQICCIVGAIGCLVGLISIAAGIEGAFKINGITFHSLIEKSAETSIGTIISSTAVGFIICFGECLIAKRAHKYFTNELIAGTPFTLDGAEEMKKLGIFTVVVSLVSVILSEVAYEVVNKMYTDIADMHIDGVQSISIGVAFIIVSVILKYGTEMIEAKNKDANKLSV